MRYKKKYRKKPRHTEHSKKELEKTQFININEYNLKHLILYFVIVDVGWKLQPNQSDSRSSSKRKRKN